MKNYKKIQTEAFAKEVMSGTYSAEHKRKGESVVFFVKVISEALGTDWDSGKLATVLEAGMGDGGWLEVLADARRGAIECSGFDITPEMVSLAKKRFSKISSSVASVGFFDVGDITEIKDYFKGKKDSGYDLVFCYDVIQQLPKGLQVAAVKCMLEATKKRGRVIIFDKHKWSSHGIKMNIKKLITKYTPKKIVPIFYLNAKYPNLTKIMRQIHNELKCRSYLIPDQSKKHFALVIEK